MEPNTIGLGGSLQVPNVQELVAKEYLTTLPPRYIHPDQELVATEHLTDSLPEIPVIDLDSLLCCGDHEANSELRKFHHACKDWGFFQLIHHGVSPSLVEKLKMEIQEFFKLPMEEKKKLWQVQGDLEGFGQAFVVSEEQKLDWADLFYMITLPTHTRKPHLFPNLPLPLSSKFSGFIRGAEKERERGGEGYEERYDPVDLEKWMDTLLADMAFSYWWTANWRDTIETYSVELKNLATKILSLMAKALKMKDEDMRNLFEEGMQSMRMNYYPPCPQPELAIGLSPHSDGGGLTILLQVNEMEGLQIKKDGIWIPVVPLPGAFVVNIGDMLEIATNGNYRSIEHRATVNREKERLSIATFLTAKLDGELGPMPSLITRDSPALFRTVTVADFLRGYFSRELHGKSYVDVMRIQTEEA